MFDAQVVLSPKNSPRGKLLERYVRLRVPRMDDVNIGLFDYDRYNTLYFFVLNADEHIYLRYGGRDANSQDTYLSLDSLELALKKGLELHERYQRGEIKPGPAPKAVYAREFPLLVERTFKSGACVECHLIGDFQNQHRELDGTLDRPTHLYRSPDFKLIGLYLDPPKGPVVKEARNEAAAAGLKPGDAITAVDGVPVYTIADLQYRYDKVDRKAERVRFTVERGGAAQDLTVALPPRWWATDIRFRQWTVDPRVYFESKPLDEAEKKELGLEAVGFASRVSHVDGFARMLRAHELQPGDIVYAVDGATADPLANTAEFYIKLRKKAGDPVTLDVIREGKRFKMEAKTFRMAFRK